MGNTNGGSNQEPEDTEEVQRLAAIGDLQRSVFIAYISILEEHFHGEIITPDQREAYTRARERPFNLDNRGFPLLIVRPRGAGEVLRTLDFVRRYNTGPDKARFCVMCGGHSGRCMLSGAIVLDLIFLNEVAVDPALCTARIGGGAYLQTLDHALQEHNLAVPVGSYPLTGVGGLTLAGGYGWLTRLHGFTVDSLLEVEVALADGTLVTANDTNEHAELIRACRGGGGNFGVVTRFTLRVHRLPPSVFGGLNVFIAPTYDSMLHCCLSFDRLIQTCPPATSGAIVYGEGPVVPTMWAYFGEAVAPAEVPELECARRLGVAVEASVRPMSYHRGVQELTSQHSATGCLYTSVVQVGSAQECLPQSFHEELLAHSRGPRPSALEKAVVVLFSTGGNAQQLEGRPPTSLDATVRGCRYFALVETKWRAKAGAAGREAAREWAREAVRILRGYRTQRMLYAPDALAEGEGPLDLRFQEGTVLDLRRIKTRYDPGNFFCENANIAPLPLKEGAGQRLSRAESAAADTEAIAIKVETEILATYQTRGVTETSPDSDGV